MVNICRFSICPMQKHLKVIYIFGHVFFNRFVNIWYLRFPPSRWSVWATFHMLKPGTHFKFFFVQPSGLSHCINYAMLVQQSAPLSYYVLTGGRLPCQNTPVCALSHWLKALIGCRSAEIFRSYRLFRLSGQLLHTRAECRPVSIEPANTAQYSGQCVQPFTRPILIAEKAFCV